MEAVLWYVFTGTRGGPNRVRLLRAVDERPRNANQPAVVRDHEKAHVDAIANTIETLGGDPVAEAEYTFEYESPSAFLATAQVLENTGVSAYAGAAPTVSNDEVFQAAAAIHSVEARHAGFLNELNGDSPYPDAVDEANPMDAVTDAVQPFIEN